MSKPSDYDAHAERRAQEFASGKNLVHAYVEKPAMYALLPELKGKTALCVGCGTGEECAELMARGAKVVGIDASSASIAYAAEHVPGVEFKIVDMDSASDLLKLGENQFDVIYSSLTLHYSNDLQVLLSNLYKLLKPRGALLFSVGHPLRWSAEMHQDGDTKSVLMGYRQESNKVQIYGDYLSTKQFTQTLSDGPTVIYWMRPISAYFKLLKAAGFDLRKFEEPTPTPEAQQTDKLFWELRSKMPVDMVFLAQKT